MACAGRGGNVEVRSVTGMPPMVERDVPTGAAAGVPLKPLGGKVPGADGLPVGGAENPLGGAVIGAAAGLAETVAAGPA